MSRRILVWDVPTRLFHWSFATSFAVAWLTSENDRWLSVHIFCGYLMLGMICFRLIWGVAGGHYARFASFLYSPMAGLAYLRQALSGHAARHVGHNPAGSQAVYILLALGLAAGITGLIAQGGQEQHGPFAGLLSIAMGETFKDYHEIIATLMLLLVFGHLAGVVMESWLHKENLPRSMVTGIKDAPEGAPISRPYRLTGALMLIALTAFGIWWFSYALHKPVKALFGYEYGDPKALHVAFVSARLPDNPKWREECGSCHLAFHPSLLPARSWQRAMAEQDKHFGTDLALDDATSKELLVYALNNSAENTDREAAFKINRSIKPGAAPLRKRCCWVASAAISRAISHTGSRTKPVKSSKARQ
ncbi:MAG: cytochrome b/b6 domain-containing protein [Gallionellaceae bacterium]|nr:cytochrome b/b6 domain-containing protein [Gallionellaceae bacterium]